MKKPTEIAKESEHSQQSAFFAYCNLAMWCGFDAVDDWIYKGKPLVKPESMMIPELKWIHAIPNGGARGNEHQLKKFMDKYKNNYSVYKVLMEFKSALTTGSIRGAALKAEGVKDGIPDVFWPFPTLLKCGLYIEFKRPDLRPKTLGTKGGCSDSQIEFANYAIKAGYNWQIAYCWEEAVMHIKLYYSSNK